MNLVEAEENLRDLEMWALLGNGFVSTSLVMSQQPGYW